MATTLCERVFVPAAFVGLLADRPAVSAPAATWESWLDDTWQELYRSFGTERGMVALRLADTLHRLQWAIRADRPTARTEVTA